MADRIGKSLLVVALVVFAVVGGLIGVGILRGWRRRGYLTVAPTLLILGGVFLSFQAVGVVIVVILKVLGYSLNDAQLPATAIGQLLVMLGGTVLVSRMLDQNPFAVFRLEGFSETRASTYLLALPIILSAQFFGSALCALWTNVLQNFSFYAPLAKFEHTSDSMMEGLVTANSVLQFVVVLLTVAVIPAFAEETLFRGFTQTNIERSGKRGPRPMVALVITSLLFAAYHTSVFKFPGLLVLGGALGWMAYRTNNLFVGSLGHAVNNGLIVTALALTPTATTAAAQKQLVESGEMTSTEALIAIAIWLPALVVSLYWFAQNTRYMTARQAPYEEYEEYLAEEQAFELTPAHEDHDRTDDREETGA